MAWEVKEECTMGYEGGNHGKGKLGECLDPQERQGSIAGEGRAGGADPIGNSLLHIMHMSEGLKGGVALPRLWAAGSLLLSKGY